MDTNTTTAALQRDVDTLVDDDGEAVSDEVAAELAAVQEAEREAAAAEATERSRLEASLDSVRRELEAEREQARAAVARYRDAVLAAEPDIPPELVSGETLEAVEASLAAARETVARIRARLEQERQAAPAFPVGAPARGPVSTSGLSASEKIARGLEAAARGR